MNSTRLITVVLAALAISASGGRAAAAGGEGVALAVVYDTSGSMQDAVKDAKGVRSPKFEIANRALLALTEQVRAFASHAEGERNVQAALFTFEGQGARAQIPMGKFDAEAFRRFAEGFRNPNGNTPLGNALTAAGQAVLNSPLPRKHVLVITDGLNTAGPQPAAVMPRLKQQADRKQALVAVHFIAFDIDAKPFAPLRKLGATVVSAADEKQLNTQLDYILQKKILLEDEDPKP